MSDNILNIISNAFELKDVDPAQVSPLSLAYVGDAIYEVVVRTITINVKGNRDMKYINKDSIKYVQAGTQAKLAELLMDDFTEEEANQYRRGRNAKSGTSAKNASIGDYRKATGFEAVMGYLYLSGKNDRIVELCKLGFSKAGLI